MYIELDCSFLPFTNLTDLKAFCSQRKILLHLKPHIARCLHTCNAFFSMEIQIDNAPSQVFIKGLFCRETHFLYNMNKFQPPMSLDIFRLPSQFFLAVLPLASTLYRIIQNLENILILLSFNGSTQEQVAQEQ